MISYDIHEWTANQHMRHYAHSLEESPCCGGAHIASPSDWYPGLLRQAEVGAPNMQSTLRRQFFFFKTFGFASHSWMDSHWLDILVRTSVIHTGHCTIYSKPIFCRYIR